MRGCLPTLCIWALSKYFLGKVITPDVARGAIRSSRERPIPSHPIGPVASHRIPAHPGGSVVAAWGGGDLSPPISDATGQCGAGVSPQMARGLLSAASSSFEILERGKVSSCRGGCWRRAGALHLPLPHRGMLSPRVSREAPRCFRLSLPLKGIALPAPRCFFFLSLPASPMSDYLFQQHNAACRGNRL